MKKFLQKIGVLAGLIGIIIGASLPGDLAVFATAGADDVDPSGVALVPDIYIKSINPGYTIDGVANVGEMIEMGKRDADALISLAGFTISYTNSSGNETIIVEFPENSWMAGESILLRLASSPGSELANLDYTKTLAFKAGPLVLKRGDEVIDTVCWTGKEGCAREFKSASPTTLVRDAETGEFRHELEYEPRYDAAAYDVRVVEGEGGGGGGSGTGDSEEGGATDGKGSVDGSDEGDTPEGEAEGAGTRKQCVGLEFSEVLSYYEELQSEQFIEVHNAAAEQILLNGCQIRYKNKYYPLNGIVKADGYMARYLDDFKITKNPNNYNTLEIIDVDGEVVDILEYPNGQHRGTTYAKIGYDKDGKELWRVTYAVTPGEPNIYQEYKSCEAGKVINEETGNCVKVTEVAEKVCKEGQYLNPLTGRCKKIEEEKAPKECEEGYYLNEETGRCRKIQDNKGAEYEIETEEYEEKSSFVALYAILGIVAAGIVLVVFEFRHEIARLLRKVWRRSR